VGAGRSPCSASSPSLMVQTAEHWLPSRCSHVVGRSRRRRWLLDNRCRPCVAWCGSRWWSARGSAFAPICAHRAAVGQRQMRRWALAVASSPAPAFRATPAGEGVVAGGVVHQASDFLHHRAAAWVCALRAFLWHRARPGPRRNDDSLRVWRSHAHDAAVLRSRHPSVGKPVRATACQSTPSRIAGPGRVVQHRLRAVFRLVKNRDVSRDASRSPPSTGYGPSQRLGSLQAARRPVPALRQLRRRTRSPMWLSRALFFACRVARSWAARQRGWSG